MPQAKLITLEGIEGTGKSTHTVFIAKILESKGYRTIVTREPGGTQLGEAVRELLLHKKDCSILPITELLLMFSARAQHIEEVITPALQNGIAVICDRFTDATYAYQGGGRGISKDIITLLEKYIQKNLTPDLTLLFDATCETSLRRASKRENIDRFESESLNFFNTVRQTYLARAADEPDRIKVIDAEQDITSVQNQISAILDKLI